MNFIIHRSSCFVIHHSSFIICFQSLSSTRSWNRFDGSLMPAASRRLTKVGRTPVAISLDPFRSAAVVVAVLVVGVGLSVLAYAVTVRPFLDRSQRSEDVLGWVAGGVTAGLVVRTALGLALPAAAYAVPDPVHLDALTSSGSITLPGGGTVGVRVIPVLVVALLTAAGADLFVHDIEQGMQGTEVKAAFLKTACDAPGMVPNVEKLHRAAARASNRTGVPIMAHSQPSSGTA